MATLQGLQQCCPSAQRLLTFVVLLLRVAGAKHLQDAHRIRRAALLQPVESALVEVVQLDLRAALI
jgi:hypothetical protein